MKIIVGVIALLLAMLLLCVRIILKKNGKFSSQHISENQRMRQDGIHCATSQDRAARKNKKTRIDVRQM
ncbi:MAG: hypothetical protein IKV31_05075 [Paludibacteraceae bacterium]|nr:hypothetical protein [Paludibacteraceae bacterium]